MTQEEKQLLLKDLCGRLPHRVLVSYNNEVRPLFGIEPTQHYVITLDNEINGNHNGLEYCVLEECKPYLRPMSSMTEEEKREVREFGVSDDGAFHNDVYDVGICMEEAFTAISWYLERHFDINYLIQKGLALEAPEGMYEF